MRETRGDGGGVAGEVRRLGLAGIYGFRRLILIFLLILILHHSNTFLAMSLSPYPFAAKEPTGLV